VRINIVHPVIVIMRGGDRSHFFTLQRAISRPQGKCGFPFVNEARYKSSISKFVSTNKDTYFSLPAYILIHGVNVLMSFANGRYEVTAVSFIGKCAVVIMLCG
jgi:hypothetical protein